MTYGRGRNEERLDPPAPIREGSQTLIRRSVPTASPLRGSGAGPKGTFCLPLTTSAVPADFAGFRRRRRGVGHGGKPKRRIGAPLDAASGQESQRSRPARPTTGAGTSRCVATYFPPLAAAKAAFLRKVR